MLPASVVLVAMALRVAGYVGQRSLWFDEAALALNIVSRSYRELAAPLSFDQSAPLFFLWIEKLAIQLFGPSELALRLVPLAAGIAAVPLTYRLAARLSARTTAGVAAALVGVAPMSVYYATELKPYSLDALLALAVTNLAVSWIDQPDSKRMDWRLASLGVLVPWCSAAGVFVLAATSVAVWLTAWRRRVPLAPILVTTVLWATSFVAAYWVTYGAAAHSPYMQRFWGSSYLALGTPGVTTRVGWAVSELVWGGLVGHTSAWVVAETPMLLVATVVAGCLVLAAFGAHRLGRAHGVGCLVLLLGPVAAAFGASTLGVYPTALRLVLFAVPSLAVLVANGVEALTGLLGRKQTPTESLVWMVSVLVLLVPPLTLSIGDLSTPEREPLRESIRAFERGHAPGDGVYVTAGAGPSWVFYTTDWRAPDRERLEWYERVLSFGGPAFANAPSRGRRVEQEGDGVHRRYRDWVEMPALSTGLEFQEARGFIGALRPDSGWVDNEVRRLEGLGVARLWAVLSRYRYPAEAEVVGRLEKRGAHEEFRVLRRWHGAESGLVALNISHGRGDIVEAHSSAPILRHLLGVVRGR